MTFYKYQIAYIMDLKRNYFNKVEFEHVLYDEIETFRDHKHQDFKYPYGPRKTSINSFILNPQKFQVEIDDTEAKIYPEIDYEFKLQHVNL